jgi:rSAM/selenodomain-associated transferase 2/rSAM/selenodomain-associated transferase 1
MKAMRQAIIIFTRIPIQGKTKTRMMPHLSPRQCAALHACFLMDIRKQCEACGADLFVSYAAENGKLERLRTLLGEEKRYIPQKGKNLGERMLHAFQQVFEQGYDSCVLIGTDVPELRECHLKKAFWKLQEQDIVFGKTMDGGYYLVGMKKPQPLVFGLDEYGHSRVLEETLAQISEAGLTAGFTDTLSDMDTPEDLRGLYERIRRDPDLAASRTGRFVTKNRKISIIIPIYNERKTIESMQRQLLVLKDRCEILFVDGGSTDGTQDLIWPEYRMISSGKGRACQMNTGAVNSTGDILFFLHCDSELPQNPLGEIRRVLSGHRAGCFGIAFHSKNFFMFTCQVISNHRIKDRKVMFGDQGIFIDRALFFQAGMFPEIPIMEDYQFSLTLKEMGVKLGMARHRIYTSDRRFPRGTIPKLKLMWKMNRLRKMYRDGVSIEKIARLYQDIR